LLFAARCAAAMPSASAEISRQWLSTSLEILKHSFHLLCCEPGFERAEFAALAGFVLFVGVQAISARWDSTNHLRNFLSGQETASLAPVSDCGCRINGDNSVPFRHSFGRVRRFYEYSAG
jgi:hypothetical protein